MQRRVKFIQIYQTNIFLQLFDKIHILYTTLEMAENQHQYTLDLSKDLNGS